MPSDPATNANQPARRTMTIDPVTRIEGHASSESVTNSAGRPSVAPP